MHRRFRFLYEVGKVLLLALYPLTAWAAVTIMNTLEGLTWGIVGILFFISSLAGLTALVVRLDREVRSTGKPIIAPVLFAAVNMLGAWTAATLAFFVAESWNFSDWSELGLILVASFGGARVLEKVTDKYLERYLGALPTPPGMPTTAATKKEDTKNDPTTVQ